MGQNNHIFCRHTKKRRTFCTNDIFFAMSIKAFEYCSFIIALLWYVPSVIKAAFWCNSLRILGMWLFSMSFIFHAVAPEFWGTIVSINCDLHSLKWRVMVDDDWYPNMAAATLKLKLLLQIQKNSNKCWRDAPIIHISRNFAFVFKSCFSCNNVLLSKINKNKATQKKAKHKTHLIYRSMFLRFLLRGMSWICIAFC